MSLHTTTNYGYMYTLNIYHERYYGWLWLSCDWLPLPSMIYVPWRYLSMRAKLLHIVHALWTHGRGIATYLHTYIHTHIGIGKFAFCYFCKQVIEKWREEKKSQDLFSSLTRLKVINYITLLLLYSGLAQARPSYPPPGTYNPCTNSALTKLVTVSWWHSQWATNMPASDILPTRCLNHRLLGPISYMYIIDCCTQAAISVSLYCWVT